ncbi:MAG: hypothetical protein K2L55_04000 [Muribaculaceae bacterium]|nr:hypothetical protein [Muribaculaceae bacterium]MDE6345815.1 hypothetical protein [Muribaculaceae bacterium]
MEKGITAASCECRALDKNNKNRGKRLENAVLAFFLVVASSQIYPPFFSVGKIIKNFRHK